MTPEQIQTIRENRWWAKARKLRLAVAEKIGQILGIPASDIEFSDRQTTERLQEMLVATSRKATTVDTPSRSAAIELLRSEFINFQGPALYFPFHFADCGVVPIRFESGIGSLEALLREMQEFFCLMSVDGTSGAIIGTEEGKDEVFPRWVTFWHKRADLPAGFNDLH